MRIAAWLTAGGIAGLCAGLVLDALVRMPVRELRILQLLLIVLGAVLAAFVFEGAKTAAGGTDPAESTDPPSPPVPPTRRFAVRKR